MKQLIHGDGTNQASAGYPLAGVLFTRLPDMLGSTSIVAIEQHWTK